MISNIERLYSPAEVHDEGLSGVVMPYEELAPQIGYMVQYASGGFAGRMSDVLMNVQHDDTQLIGRTGPSGNVHLTDTPEQMLISFKYPDTQLGADTKKLVDMGVLTGFSAETLILSDEWRGGVRRITKSKLTGVALVAKPAMKTALITSKYGAIPFGRYEKGYGDYGYDRSMLAARDMRGELNWGEPSIVSMRHRTAVQFERDSLDIEAMPITLLLGSDFNNSAANTAGDGSLSVTKTNKGISWRVRNMPRTENGERILNLAREGLITGWRAGYIPIETHGEKITLAGIEVELQIVDKGILCDIALATDGSGGAGNVAPARRRRRRRA